MCSLEIRRKTCVVSLLLFATSIGHVIFSGEAKGHIKNLLYSPPVTIEADQTVHPTIFVKVEKWAKNGEKGQNSQPLSPLSPTAVNVEADQTVRHRDLCSPQNFSDLRWVLGDQLSNIPPCCSWDAGQRGKNAKACGVGPMPKTIVKVGKSLLNGYNGSSNSANFIHLGGHGCACRDAGMEHKLVHLSPSYCDLARWDPQDFCSRIGAGILLIGDSTMEQTASVLMNHVLLSKSTSDCSKNIHFGKSDLLVEPSRHVLERGAPWMGTPKPAQTPQRG